MRFWQWATRQFMFFQDGAPSIPVVTTPGHTSDSHTSRPANPVVGGFAYRPPNFDPTGHGSLGSYGPGTAPSNPFDPYRDRDQRRILGRLVNQGGIYDLQLALMQAGLLDRDADMGIINDDTTDAFSTVLSIANQHGLDWRDVLSQMAASGGDGGGFSAGGSGAAPLAPTVIELPNRDDVIAGAHETGMALTGTALDDDLSEAIADSLLDTLRTQQERQVQREMSAGEGVLFTEGNPDPARLLEEEVRERAPDLVAAKGARDLRDLWFQDMAGPIP